MSDKSNLRITTIEELAAIAKGEVVELPPFQEGVPFVARLKRPSLMGLVKSGRIPNSLVKTASKLFNGKGVDDNNDKAMSQVFDVFDALCEAAFVEPAWKDLKEAGIELTDEQYMAVFGYTQKGIESLAPFRSQQGSASADGGSTAV